MTTFIRMFHNDESGQDLIEYALVAALIALGATVGLSPVGTAINSAFAKISTSFASALSTQ
jgi:pilus assembly protein Flp/PilA